MLACIHCEAEFSCSEDLAQHNLFWHLNLQASSLSFSKSSKKKGEKTSLEYLKPVIKERVEDRSGSNADRINELVQDPEQLQNIRQIEDDIDANTISYYSGAKMSPSICPVCNKFFRYKYNLQRHLNTHSTYFRHRCYVCGRGFHRSDFMQRHIRTVHKHLVETHFKQT